MNIAQRKHKKALKRKRTVAKKRKNIVNLLEQRKSPAFRAREYYVQVCRAIKQYGRETQEYKELFKMKTAYERLQAKKSEEAKKEKPVKQLPVYRVVKLTAQLDKVEAEIKKTNDEVQLKKLKTKRLSLKQKLHLK